jgi:hypothetical protein
MMEVPPLPFRLSAPGEETIGIAGVKSIGYKMVGQIHLNDQWLVIEWTGTRTTEKLGITGIGTDVDQLPLEKFEIPVDHIVGARLTRAWWLPRLVLRALELDLFDDIPGSEPGIVSLRIKRSDRALALDFIMALEDAQYGASLPAGEEYDEITDGVLGQLDKGSTSGF